MSFNLDDVKARFDLWFHELGQVCAIENPWGFVCLSALIEYLSKLANGADLRGKGYKDFIRDYFPDKYKRFRYASGDQDLPKQMYHVLRCGIVHSFSLIPDDLAKKEGHDGRDRSVALIHRRAAFEDGLSHLENYAGVNGDLDAALLVAEDFLDDIKSVAYGMLDKASTDSQLESNILSWFSKYPPISGGF